MQFPLLSAEQGATKPIDRCSAYVPTLAAERGRQIAVTAFVDGDRVGVIGSATSVWSAQETPRYWPV